MEAEQRGAAGLDDRALAARWGYVAEAVEALSAARSMDEVIDVLGARARRIIGCEGVVLVVRDGDLCRCVAEDSVESLWLGQSFRWEESVAGWAMHHATTMSESDVLLDPRVPPDGYADTYVRSMLVTPIGRGQPRAAIAALWSESGRPGDNQVAMLETLARAASAALERGRLLASLEELNSELDQCVRTRTAELEQSQDVLRQVQKTEIVGQLTGHVAHDFNNLLSPIIAGLDAVLTDNLPHDAVLRRAQMAMQAAESAQTLVQRLLAFARRQPLAPTGVDLVDLMAGMEAMLRSTIGPRIDLVVDLAADLPPVHADRNQLELAILNLAVNGRDAMPDGGVLKIAASPCTRRATSGQRRKFIRLSVTDNGTGMDAATRALAVEPFFTTKPVGHGTGLGLSMVHGFAGQSGGILEIESELGRGTSVIVTLPAGLAEVESPAGESAEVHAAGSQGKVLLVDDNELVRHSTCEMLMELGYEVVEATMAEEALAMIELGERPDLVVTDHIMPGMSGAELAVRLRRDHPGIALLIISGFEGVELIAPDVARLSKPFRSRHLQASIAAARALVS